MTLESSDTCIFCGPGQCECITKKKKPKPKKKPVRKTESSPPAGADNKPAERLAKPERKSKSTARPPRTGALISTERHRRSEDAEIFWDAMKNLVNEGMVHEISVKRSLDVYPNIPGGLYG